MTEPYVVERCLGYLCRIATTGVEDKMPHTKIIISSKENIFSNTEEVMIDPSYGYGENKPNIFGKNFYQTFKSWAVLKGCICLSPEGDIVAVGRDVGDFESPLDTPKWGIASSSKFECVIIEVVSKDHIVVYMNGMITMEVKSARIAAAT